MTRNRSVVPAKTFGTVGDLMSRFLRGKVFRMRAISINDSVNSDVCSEVLCLSPVACSLAVFRTASRAATRSSCTRNDGSSELIILTASETKQGKGNYWP